MANGRRLSVENVDGENVDELIKNLSNSSIFSPVKNLRHTVYHISTFIAVVL